MEPVQRTKLTVQFAGSVLPWSSENLELPIEVRRLDSALVGRTLATGSLDVGPGIYIVRAAALGGEFAGSIEVPPGQVEATVLLRFFDRPQPSAAVDLADSRTRHSASGAHAASRFTMDVLEGHVFLGHPLTVSAAAQRDAGGRLRIASAGSSAVIRVQAQDRAASLIAPIPQSAATHLAWEDASSDARPDITFHLDHPQARLLLSYLRRNALAEARLAAQSATLTAAQLLRGKKWDPLAGALGAYVLLRQSDPDAQLIAELLDRSEQLWKYNRTFPDAWCIRAECRARAGEHRAAFDTLLELSGLGLPFFSAGLSIAGMRLAEYLEPEAVSDLDEEARRRATVLLRRLRWLGLHALPGEPILKIANFDPGNAEQYQDFWNSTAG